MVELLEKDVICLDKNDQEVESPYFKNLNVGDVTNLHDGNYVVEKSIYKISGGNLIYILPEDAADGQISFWSESDAVLSI